MQKQLDYEVPENGGLVIDFDNETTATYEFTLPSESEGDEIVLTVNPAACIAFARLFAQLAEYHGHVHLGLTHEVPQGPGIRIVVNNDR